MYKAFHVLEISLLLLLKISSAMQEKPFDSLKKFSDLWWGCATNVSTETYSKWWHQFIRHTFYCIASTCHLRFSCGIYVGGLAAISPLLHNMLFGMRRADGKNHLSVVSEVLPYYHCWHKHNVLKVVMLSAVLWTAINIVYWWIHLITNTLTFRFARSAICCKREWMQRTVLCSSYCC